MDTDLFSLLLRFAIIVCVLAASLYVGFHFLIKYW